MNTYDRFPVYDTAPVDADTDGATVVEDGTAVAVVAEVDLELSNDEEVADVAGA